MSTDTTEVTASLNRYFLLNFPAEAARQILLDLDMDGSHTVQGNPTGERLTITRQQGATNRRIVFLPNSDDLTEAITRIERFLAQYRKRHSV